MRYILFILLFISLKTYSQFSLVGTSQAFAGSATLAIGSGTYSGGNTYVIFISTTVSSGVPTDNPTISSGSLVLKKQGTVTGTNCRIICYTFNPAATTTTTITFTFAETQNAQFNATYAASNIGTKRPVINIATGGGTGANPLLTLPNNGSSYSIGYFFNNKNPFGGTPESGWTEDFDNGIATPFGSAGYHSNATTDNTIQVTAASSSWIGLGIQFTPRRIFNIN